MIQTRLILAAAIVAAQVIATASRAAAQTPPTTTTTTTTTTPDMPATDMPASDTPAPDTTPVPPPRSPEPAAVLSSSTDAESRTAGWNTPWALLFSLNNVLQVQQVLGEFQGLGIAGRYHRSSKRAIRFGASLDRVSTPQEVVKTTTTVGTDRTSMFTVTPGNSVNSIAVAGDYLMRMTERSISPYAGAGAFFAWSRAATELEDDVSATDQVHTLNQREFDTTLGVRGVFGVEWRVHGSFSLFAEYALTMPLIHWHSFSRTDTRTDTANNASLQTTEENKTTEWFNFGVGLAQGASFGLAALF